MSKLISLSLDVTKINKSELISGAKGTYLNLTISLNDDQDKFGNTVSAWQSQSKEQREAKEDRLFLGNGKVVFDGDANKGATTTKSKSKVEELEDILPF